MQKYISILPLLFLFVSACGTTEHIPDLGGIYNALAMQEDPHRNPVIVIPGLLGSKLVDPDTGEKNLFVGRHAFGIPGLPREESKRLIRSLIEFVVSDPARVYTHKWQAGDTLLWDNRAILHRAEPYDYTKARVLIGTRVAGEPESELAYYPSDPQAQAGRDALTAELEVLREEAKDRRYAATTAVDRLEIRGVRY